MNVDTGDLYDSIEDAIAAGEKRERLVEIRASREAAEELSEKVKLAAKLKELMRSAEVKPGEQLSQKIEAIRGAINPHAGWRVGKVERRDESGASFRFDAVNAHRTVRVATLGSHQATIHVTDDDAPRTAITFGGAPTDVIVACLQAILDAAY